MRSRPQRFFRAFKQTQNSPRIDVFLGYDQNIRQQLTGQVTVRLVNHDTERAHSIQLIDNAYQADNQLIRLEKGGSKGAQQTIVLNLATSHNWYDFSLKATGFDDFEQRYAGRVETGKASFSDPQLGEAIKTPISKL